MQKKVTEKIVFKLYDPFSQRDIVKEIWTSLLKICPHTYFMSWDWKELWIHKIPRDCKLSLVAGFLNELPVLAFFVGTKTTRRYNIYKFRQLSVDSTLIPAVDNSLYVEYDGILINPEITISLTSLMQNIPMKWDELHIPRCTSIYNPNFKISSSNSKRYNLLIKDSRAYYVDLDKVRSNDYDYLSLLSYKMRSHIRRSIEEYEKAGKLQITAAESVNEAFEILDELIELHQKIWTERGQPGTFSNKSVVDFHKSLISRRFEYGEIQLLKVTAGDHTLGCLYNFIYNDKHFGYLCAFNYLPGKFYKPGLVSHHLSILRYAESGLSCYDFLEGEEGYKKSLSTDHNEIRKVIVRKRNIKYYIERAVLKLSRIYKERLASRQ